MSDRVRVGIAGAGAIAQVAHLPAYAGLPRVEIAGLCDEDLAKAKRVGAKYNVRYVTDSFQELAARDDLDAIDICLPNHLHAPATLAALAHGKHVLCEKPFSRGSSEAAAMVEAARKADRILMSGFNNRFREDANILKRFVSEGELGEVFSVKAGWLRTPPTQRRPAWQTQKRYAGGGVILDLGVQILDLALWFLDTPRVVTVLAAAHPVPVDDRLETTATALLRLEGGASITLEVSYGMHAEKETATLDLYGERGVAHLSPPEILKEMHGSLVNVTPRLGPHGSGYQRSYQNEIRHFIACVRSGHSPLSPGHDAVQVLRVVEALTESAVSGREVRLS